MLLATSSFPLSSFCRINHLAGIYIFHSLSGSFWYDLAACVSLVVLNLSWEVSLILQEAKSSFLGSLDLWRGPSYFVLFFVYGSDWGFSSFRVLKVKTLSNTYKCYFLIFIEIKYFKWNNFNVIQNLKMLPSLLIKIDHSCIDLYAFMRCWLTGS